MGQSAAIQLPLLKVLFVSGYADAPFSDQKLLPAGAHFLAKPCVLRNLAAKIRTILKE